MEGTRRKGSSKEEPSRRDFLRTAKTVAIGTAATGLAFETAEYFRNPEHERSPEIICEFGALAGQPCYGLATEYFGFFGDRAFPERARENFQETYGRLWDRKAKLVGSDLMEARAELKKREYAESWGRNGEHRDAGDFIELVNSFAATERKVLSGFDWEMLGHYYGIRGEWELQMLKHLTSRAHGQSLMAFSMTEIMPYGPDYAPYNVACYDTLVKYAGSAFVEGIPALGDRLNSWGPFQHTAEHAIDAGIGRRRSLSLGPQDPLLERYEDLRDPEKPHTIRISLIDLLSDETSIPRELDSFSGMKDHATAALLLGLDHVALAVRALHREGNLEALERIDTEMDGAAFASVLAAHHYRPGVAHPALLSWARSEHPGESYVELCRRRDLSVGNYAHRSAANFEAIRRYSDALLTLDK